MTIAVPIAIFSFFSQSVYPKAYSTRKEKDIDKNLIPALEDILVQLNSGVPLFTIMVNISSSGYGELSYEFKKVVKKINSGMPQIEVIEELGEKNPSLFFRRTLWQLSNGMRAGSDISVIIKESIKSLNEEQLIQIQSYGNKLNPMIMFYMLSSVIMPALAITFLTILSSLVNLSESITQILFFAMFGGVAFIQFMFIGVIRSLRPSLL
jgi:flagellar protein FlaJ